MFLAGPPVPIGTPDGGLPNRELELNPFRVISTDIRV
jgi:hypothetical protein